MKRKARIAAAVVLAFLPIFGLLGCGESEKFTADDLVLIHAVYYGTERNPVYCFALKKEENGWLFSADCLVGEQKEHYASFESFPIPAEDAAGFLQIISEDGEIKKLYRHRNPIRFFHISDVPARSLGMTFCDGSTMEKDAELGDRALDYLYDYTETSHFMVHRGGSVGFEHVPVDGSSKMADDLMESIEPYNISDAVHFQTAYLAGYVADKYDVTAEESVDRANQRVKRSTEEVFAETVEGYTTVTPENTNVQFHGGKARYALYPVWLLNTTWNGNQYVFAMNGQTGKFVGDLPVDKAAAKRWTFLLAAIFSVASYGVAWGLHLIGLI